MCIWLWASFRKDLQCKEARLQNASTPENSHGVSLVGSSRLTPAPMSQVSTTSPGGGKTSAHLMMTTDDSIALARPGQPANPVSLEFLKQPDTLKGAPGVSYESDDEGDSAATVEERLRDITRSVKGYAKAAGAASKDDAVRRQVEVAAKRLAAERFDAQDDAAKASAAAVVEGPTGAADGEARAPAAPSVAAVADGAVAGTTAAPQPGQHKAATAAGEAAVADGGGKDCNDLKIDLDIDLTRGDLKVDYSTRGLLGQGGFAAVYKGRYKGQRVAVKIIQNTAGPSLADLQEDVKALMHELHILRQVHHPNIVTLFGGCLKPPHIFLVEERMEGTLDFYVHRVRKHDAMSVQEVVSCALDIAYGLSYLHPRIIHRDLKPANVLLSREGRCKISDFGLARTKLKEYLSTKNLDAGTTAYIAPECFMSMDNPDLEDLRRSVTDRTDIYALGIIMWEMLAGKRPWPGVKPLMVAFQVAYRGLRPPLFELGSQCPPKMRELIEECWCQEPKLRPSSQQVVDRLLKILNALPAEQDYAVDTPAQTQAQPELCALKQQQQQQAQPVPEVAVAPHDVMLES